MLSVVANLRHCVTHYSPRRTKPCHSTISLATRPPRGFPVVSGCPQMARSQNAALEYKRSFTTRVGKHTWACDINKGGLQLPTSLGEYRLYLLYGEYRLYLLYGEYRLYILSGRAPAVARANKAASDSSCSLTRLHFIPALRKTQKSTNCQPQLLAEARFRTHSSARRIRFVLRSWVKSFLK